MHPRSLRFAAPLAALALAACNQTATTTVTPDATGTAAAAVQATGAAAAWNGGQARPLSLQVAHPSGTVLQLTSIEAGDMDTRIGVRVINGRDKDIDLNRFNSTRNGYLQLASGEKLYLSPPSTNTRLTVPAGQTFEGELVFLGRLPATDSAILVLNENSSTDSEYTTNPAFRIDLPLGAAPAAGAAQ